MKYNIVYEGDGPTARPTSVTVFNRGKLHVAGQDHPNFDHIVTALEQRRQVSEIVALFTPYGAIARGFRQAARLLSKVVNEAASHAVGLILSEEVDEGGDDEDDYDEDEGYIVPEATPGARSDKLSAPPRREGKVTVVDREIPEPPTTPDNLDAMGQKELMQIAAEFRISGVGKTKDWMREQIRAARTKEQAGDAKELLDVALAVQVTDSGVLFEGEPVHGALADAIIAYNRQGHSDFTPLVRFLAKLQANPNEHSRTQLYDWMKHLSFSIHTDGDLIAYKGVDKHGDTLLSRSSGKATVNGKPHDGLIPNPIGGVVEMPRDQVNHNPSEGCSRGLHVGTVSYASSWATQLIELKVNPADVVSVPTDCGWEKMRVCKYLVLREVTRDEVRTLRSHLVST